MSHPRSRFRRLVAACAVASLLAAPAASYAQSCDADTEARLTFLETRLEEGERAMDWWWGSWMTVFAVGVAWSSYQGATAGDGSNQAAYFFQAGKSALGVTQLLVRPHPGRKGADPMQRISKATPEGCAQRLTLAEKNMRRAAKDGNMRWSWIAHATSLALNLGVAIIIDEGFEDEGNAWRDFGVSEASSELHIWTHPTRAVKDWDEYQREFNNQPAAQAPSSLRFAATGRGVGLVWKF